MRTKIYKLMSIVLSILIMFSVCAVAVSGAATDGPDKAVYYVNGRGGLTSKDTNPGTDKKPLKTIAGVINRAIADDYKENDTVVAQVVGSDIVDWGEMVPHDFTLVITSDVANAQVGTTANNAEFMGPVEIGNVEVLTKTQESKYFFGNKSFKIDSKAKLLASATFKLGQSARGVPEIDYPINAHFEYPAQYIEINNDFESTIYKQDLNIVYDSANGAPTFYLSLQGANRYNANLNFDLKAAKSVTFSHTSDAVFAATSTLQIINSTGSSIPLEPLNVENIHTKYILNNTSSFKNALTFTEKAGKYAVDTNAYTIFATPVAGGDKIPASNGFLELPAAGVYDIEIEKVPEYEDFWVKANADVARADGSEEHPFATIDAAINASKLTSGDTLRLKVLGTDAVPWGGTVDNRGRAILTAHNFTLDIDSDTTGAIVGDTDVKLGGPTNFNNVQIKLGTLSEFFFNNNSVKLGSTSSLPYGSYTKIGNSGSEKVYQPIDAVIETSATYIEFVGTNDFYNDLTLTYNAPGAPTLYPGLGGNTFHANLNFNLKAASKITFTDHAAQAFKDTANFQIINSTGLELTKDTSGVSQVVNKINTAGGKYFIITNKSGNENLIEFTSVAGQYKVNVDYPITAVSADGTEYVSEDGILMLDESGEYLITDAHVDTLQYYVSASGTEVPAGVNREEIPTLGTKENPVKTIADVTKLINMDKLSEVDFAYANILSGETVTFGAAESYKPFLTVRTEKDGKKASISQATSMIMVGDIEFKNVDVTLTGGWNSLYFCNNNNVTFDEDSSFSGISFFTGTSRQKAEVNDDVNVVIKGAFAVTEFHLNSNEATSTHNGDINVTFANPEIQAPIYFGAANSDFTDPNTGHKCIYNGNINIKVLNTKTLGFGIYTAKSIVEFNGGLQLLVDGKLDLPYFIKENFENFNFSGGKWYIVNGSEDPDFVKFTNKAGEFDFTQGKTAYARQAMADDIYGTYTTGPIKLEKDKQYIISDSYINYIPDDSHKMLYFRGVGSSNNLWGKFYSKPGETYRFEFSTFINTYKDMKVALREGGDLWALPATVEIISDEEIFFNKDNPNATEQEKKYSYHKVVAEFTVPDTYTLTQARVSLDLSAFPEGLLFDCAVYNVNEPDKDLMLNQKFYRGLYGWDLNWEVTKKNIGFGTSHKDGTYEMRVLNFDPAEINRLYNLINPQDGEWWNKSQIVKEEEIITYADRVDGFLMDTEGKPLKGFKMLFEGVNDAYTAVSDAKGAFEFKDVLTGFYELFIVLANGDKVSTGYTTFLEDGDGVTMHITLDLGLMANGDYENIVGGDAVEEIVANGNLSGTVYTPYLETVSNLKLYLEGIGEVVTDADGNFAFANVPVGSYKLYTVLADGSEYEFRTVSIEENVDLAVKLKYDPPVVSNSEVANNGWIVWVIVASVAALVVVAGLIFFLVLRKKNTLSV